MASHFDDAAGTWDLKPERFERAQKFAGEILRLTAGKKILSAMEFGAGTGMVSFCLKDNFSEIVMIDDSRGMIEEIEKKIRSAGVTHMRARPLNLLTENYDGKHDLIYTLLVLHHIHDVPAILRIFFNILNSGGMLVVGDLVTEDGSFHSEHPDFEGHNGFDVKELTEKLVDADFINIRSEIFYYTKKIINEEDVYFPMFVMSAEKP